MGQGYISLLLLNIETGMRFDTHLYWLSSSGAGGLFYALFFPSPFFSSPIEGISIHIDRYWSKIRREFKN